MSAPYTVIVGTRGGEIGSYQAATVAEAAALVRLHTRPGQVCTVNGADVDMGHDGLTEDEREQIEALS